MAIDYNAVNRALINDAYNKKRNKKIIVAPWLYPYHLEAQNSQGAVNVIRNIRKAYNKKIAPILQDLLTIRNDDIPQDIENTLDILDRVMNREINKFEVSTTNTALTLSSFNKKQWQKIVRKAFGVNLILKEPWVKGDVNSFTKEGVSLVTRVSNDTTKQINEIVQRGYRQGDSWRTVSKQIRENVFPKNIKRARLIGRDQINKLDGQFTKKRQTDLGLLKYIWRTVRDEKVRPEDKIMDGLICSWSHPGMYYLNGVLVPRPNGASLTHPGYAIQCRCHGEPYFQDILEQF